MECYVIFGIDTLADWMNVSAYKVRKFIANGMPCARIETDTGKSQWVFHKGSIDDWFYRKMDRRPKDPDQ